MADMPARAGGAHDTSGMVQSPAARSAAEAGRRGRWLRWTTRSRCHPRAQLLALSRGAFVVLVLLAVSVLPAAASSAGNGAAAAWGSPMAWGYGVASDVTVRQMATLSLGGRQVQIRVSNAFGTTPLTIAAASVGLQEAGPNIIPGTLRPLTFHGAPRITVPPGAVTLSDPTALRVHAGTTAAVSLFVPGTELVSVHPCCTAGPLSYFTPNGGGDRVDQPGSVGFTVSSPWARWVDMVAVSGEINRGTTVVFGDSISDGFHSTLRWPDVLTRRLAVLPPADRVGVVDEGITANTLTGVQTSDALLGGGPPGVDRLARDALSQPGVSRLVLLLGTNDLWFGATANDVIAGMRQVLARARQHDVPVIGVTLLPRAGSERWTPQMDTYRRDVNHWIRHSGAFPVVLDFASVVADVYNGACNPSAMFPPYDSGDHLHPGSAGQTAMADAVPTQLLGSVSSLQAPPLIVVMPTPGCRHRPFVLVNSSLRVQPSASPSTSSPSTPPADKSSPPASAQPIAASTRSKGNLAAAFTLGALGLAAAMVAFRRSRMGRRHRRS